MRLMFMDIETENHGYFGAVASPRHPDNYVVLNGWAIDTNPYDGAIEHIRNDSKEQAASRPWVTIPDDVWLLVCHNAPFEMDWMLHQQREEIIKFLKRGGRVFCTAYAHYLLSNQRDTYPPLDEIAPIYGGEHKVDGIKALWEKGVLTSQIDPALLLEYLISPTRGDIANTRKIFYGQYAQLVERGMWEMALERMEGMVFNCFCMDAGLMIDRETAERQRTEGEALLATLRESFKGHRASYPAQVEFKETSDFHMSAWLFGGPIKYRHRVPRFNADGKPVMVKVDAIKWLHDGKEDYLPLNEEGKVALNVSGTIQHFDPELAAHDFGLEFARYKSGKNKGLIKVERVDTTEQAQVWEDTHFVAPALCDLSLLSEAIREEFLKESTGKRKLLDESPVISTGKDALEFLTKRKEFPEYVQKVLADLNTFNKVDKDMGTYYLRQELDDDGNVVKQSGMLQYLTPMSIVHHMLNCTATATTRLSSNRPNFQNLPRGDTSDVKAMFVSRYNKPEWLAWALANGRIKQDFYDRCMANIAAGVLNGYIVELDYSALEVVTLAAFSQDKNLIKALLENIDMHCMRLAKKLNEPYDEVKKKCKDETHPDHARYSLMRTLIKPPSFAYQYGATAMGISYSTGMPLEEAEEFIKNEKELFPEVEAFYDQKVFPVVEQSKVMHREQLDDGSWQVYGRGVWQSPGGTCYEFRQYPKTITTWEGGKKQRMMVMQFKPTQMRNYPVQGESGFFVQGITGQVMRWLVANDFFEGRVTVINTVHDAIYLDCHREVLDVVCAGVKAIMESLPEYFSKKYGYTLNVPFPAAAEYGVNMKDKKHWHEGVLDEHKEAA
ncbi:DNA polymerase [Ralstonia phage RSB3]|uniref:Putative DNA polymerase n=1 Tax=Ralstonia phage RSB3 TaxID=1402875 RepID=U3TM28_9CAUD|nr:DNA polymerase [Ralstonia phage RSB3]BAN92334.1 putative DNA polymerase [Ralstonia phage RSB3]